MDSSYWYDCHMETPVFQQMLQITAYLLWTDAMGFCNFQKTEQRKSDLPTVQLHMIQVRTHTHMSNSGLQVANKYKAKQEKKEEKKEAFLG
ncbi:hypothetical protein STEG23_000838 [Scotinomys teguina]